MRPERPTKVSAIDVLPEHQGNEREVALSFMNFALDMSSDIHLQNDM
jgi:hypothetical protein